MAKEPSAMQVKLEEKAEKAKTLAEQFKTIPDKEQALKAATIRDAIKTAIKEVDEWCDPNIAAWHKGHKDAVAKKKKIVEPMKSAVSTINRALGAYQDNLRKKALAARKEAEKRARLEAEVRRQEEARALEEAGEPELAQAVASQPVKVKVVVDKIVEETKIEGVKTREHVVVEVVDKKAAAEYIVENWAFLSQLLDINMVELRKLGIAQRENFNVPGCKCVIELRAQ